MHITPSGKRPSRAAKEQPRRGFAASASSCGVMWCMRCVGVWAV